ncbi:hypothetical protein KDE13_09190 [Campylobacter sp. faydin G-140]|uniref:hypothetical protein n=1 Tax=Campylobacter anatolicus TaxID=2829105 RepID=UPI001B9800BF|nr:hypothetical protein [Campylobacter anatolicus]MBR8466507.1 hypothetical protein [Campylobacter anatolicus]
MPNSRKDEKEIFFMVGTLSILVIWGVWVLSYVGESKKPYETLPFYFYAVFIVAFVFAYKYLKSFIKKTSIDIVAKQQTYWGLSTKDIENFYNYRRILKDDRVETKINALSKKFYRNYDNTHKYLTANLFFELKELKLLEIGKIDEINAVYLYKVIFDKIKELNKQSELNPDYQKILEENGNIAEYFLIDSWLRFTKLYNIGLANLEILATNFTQEQLVGAIDNADLNSVKRHGASLYFKYALFKDLIPDDILNENDNTQKRKNSSNNSREDRDF